MYRNIRKITDISEVKNLDNSHAVRWISYNYKGVINKIIINALSVYKWIPIAIEDVFNDFLATTYQIIKKYDPSTGIPFKTFLGKTCRFYINNLFRKFTSNKYKVLNNYVNFDYSDYLNESNHISKRRTEIDCDFDTHELNEIEKKVFEDLMDLQINVHQYSKVSGISRYKVSKIIESLQTKLRWQI